MNISPLNHAARLILALLFSTGMTFSIPAQDVAPPDIMSEDMADIMATPEETPVPDEMAADGAAKPNTLGQKPTSDAIVQYDAETDSIIVITDESTNGQIAKVVEAMDRPIPQVLIKVLFLEVTHSRGLNLGVEANYSWDSENGANTQSAGTNLGIAGLLDPGVANGGGGFYKIIDSDLQATLHALATVAKTNVLSRPSVMTRNNQTAIITIGQKVPFPNTARITDSGQEINDYTYRDVGIILQVTPHITSDGLVQMDVAPEISNLTAESVQISPTVSARVISVRSAQTSVVVGNTKTVVIGGLIQDNSTKNVRKVPILGDIPLLGGLFRYQRDSKDKTELLIFLTPYVVQTQDEVQAVSAADNNKAEIPLTEFTPHQQEKFIENLPGAKPWTARNEPPQ